MDGTLAIKRAMQCLTLYFHFIFLAIVNSSSDSDIQTSPSTNTTTSFSFSVTPSLLLDDNISLRIYLFLSYDYVNRTNLTEVIGLISTLMQRRWSYPCNKYHSMKFAFSMLWNESLSNPDPCYLDGTGHSISSNITSCSSDLFRCWVNGNDWRNNFKVAYCTVAYANFVADFLANRKYRKTRKFLMITNFPLSCQARSNDIFTALKNYSDYSSGAPLTVIAIEKENDKSVSSSYAPLFPATQLPNLYAVNNITELMTNSTKKVNFCLNSVPWLDVVHWLQLRKLPYYRTVWYFYLIGAAILTAFMVAFLFLIMRRNRKRRKRRRRERIRQITHRKELVITTNTAQNQYVNKSHQTIQDDWEISLESLDIDFMTVLGKGAFSVVHKGFLHGKAPVLNIFPSIALQHLKDCYIAVKISPQHSSERDKIKFRSEIELMKNIGYHIHLISMLGCNCSIERPILLMELAKQDLLHWLTSVNMEPVLEKTLLSIAWQVSDGMSYLSSKNFVHRDLAARNILLNNEMKAMISDFGLCKKIENCNQVLTIPGGLLPLKWMALESLLKHQFSLKTDVWSFGVLLFETFNLGEEPYLQLRDGLVAFLQEGKRLSKPSFANEEIYDLMKKCWVTEPAQRPDFLIIQSCFVQMLEKCVANYGYLTTIEEKNNA